jgi:tRNA 2-selenouridine synthase
MSKPLSPTNFLQKAQYTPVIDVRSPGEFERAHIPGAINVPLFTNEERALVGTKYKNAGKDPAVLLGLEMVGPKLADFVRKVKKISPQKQVLVHCWRGGMRSGSFAWLLDTAGFEVNTMSGGYKAYRNLVLDFFEKPLKLVVLGGKTGSAKTETLHELKKMGEQVIDLEGLAHHKGSAFGAIGQPQQPSSEYFENILYDEFQKIDLTKRIWIEDESKNVGTCNIPEALWRQMRNAKVLFLDIEAEARVPFLVEKYAQAGFDNALQESLNRIQKRLGGLQFNRASEALFNKDYAEVARITLEYYDKWYLMGLLKREQKLIHKLTAINNNPEQNARILLDFLNTTNKFF